MPGISPTMWGKSHALAEMRLHLTDNVGKTPHSGRDGSHLTRFVGFACEEEEMAAAEGGGEGWVPFARKGRGSGPGRRSRTGALERGKGFDVEVRQEPQERLRETCQNRALTRGQRRGTTGAAGAAQGNVSEQSSDTRTTSRYDRSRGSGSGKRVRTEL